MANDPSNHLPLTPPVVHILLALAGEDLHGYGIMQEVLRQSDGRYKLGPGTLYDNLQRLSDQGIVQELGRPKDDPDSRRRYYRLTASGQKVLAAEVSRLERFVQDARLRLPASELRRA